MKLIYDAFTEPEPHYAQIVRASKLKPDRDLRQGGEQESQGIWDVKDASVARNGNNVVVKMVAVRARMSRTSSK